MTLIPRSAIRSTLSDQERAIDRDRDQKEIEKEGGEERAVREETERLRSGGGRGLTLAESSVVAWLSAKLVQPRPSVRRTNVGRTKLGHH